jgi:hypothetical protein
MRQTLYMKNKLHLTLLLLVAFTGLQAQLVTVPAGNTQGTGAAATVARKPYGCYFGYERTALIYLQSEIGPAGAVNSVGFYVDAAASPATVPVNIYLKNTTTASFAAATTTATEISGATLVFSGTVLSTEIVPGQWVTKTLSTPFNYDGTSNLEIIVEANYGGTGSTSEGSSGKTFRYSPAPGGVSLMQYWVQDNTAPTTTGTTVTDRTNVQLNFQAAIACAGRPTAGNTIASSNSVCSSDVLNLSISGSNPNSGITYQWISSANGTTYTNINAATSSTYSTNQTSATYYRNIVTCTNSGLSDTSAAVFVGQTACYCTVTSDCSAGDRIDTVIFAGINNYSTCGANGYTFYPSPVANVLQGVSFPISVYVTDGGQESVGVWIDYNQNGTFETSEFTDLGTQPAGDVFFTGSISIPGNALLGTTRMRIRDKFGSTVITSADPCLSYTYGETEDYLVNIAAGNNCTGNPSAGNTVASANPVCSTGNLSLSISGVNSGSGITYQWISSANGTSYTYINGANSPTYSTNQLAATYYRNIVTCTSSGLSDTSVALLVGQTQCYCTVTSDCNSGDRIDTVLFAGINNYTTCGANGYTLYNSPSANVQQGVAYPISVYVTDGGQESVGVWIDYNQNGTFETSEFTDLGTQPAGDVFFTGSITIPNNALLGTTRMRIRDKFGSTVITNADACLSYTYGETEDYLVNIAAAPACSTPPVGGTATGPSVGAVDSVYTYILTGSTGNIQWQYSTSSATGPYNDIIGSTDDTLNVVFNGAATFWIRAYLTGPGCDPDSSNAIQVGITKKGDAVCDAISLNFGINGPYNTTGAGIEAGEPSPPGYDCQVQDGWCADSTISNTLWFTFVAPASGRVSIASPDFDTQLALWDAANCNAILNGGATLLYANDDDADYSLHGSAQFSSFIDSAICLTPGKTYFVQLDPYSAPGDATTIVLTDLGAGPNASFTNLAPAYCVTAPAVTLTPATAGGTFSGTGVSGSSFSPASAGLGGPYIITYSLYACYSTSDTVNVTNGPSITATTVTPVSCNGGSNGAIDVTVTNGSGNYTYSWSNTQTTQDISGLTAGSYTLSLTDNTGNCSAVSSAIVVSEPTALSATLDSIVNVKCNGASTGGIYLTVSGGTPGYTFLWSNGTTNEDLTNLPAGVYTGTVTDSKGCTLSTPQPVPINQPTAIVITVDSTHNNFCGANDGAVYVSVSGGTAGYTYLWSNNSTNQDITGLSTGTYTLVVTDANACTVSGSGTVNNSSGLVIASAITNVTCNGANNGAINVTVTGGSGSYSFTWSNSQTTEDLSGLAAGSYTVTVDDDNSNCIATSNPLVVTEPGMLMLDNDSSTNVKCNGTATGAVYVTPMGGTAPYSFSWSNSAQTEDLTAVGAGTYLATVTDSHGCAASSSAVTITEPAAVVFTLDSATGNLCFGLTNGALYTTASGGTGNLTVIWNNTANTGDITNLASGNYTATVTDDNGCSASVTGTVSGPSAALSATSVSTDQTQGSSNGAINVTIAGGTSPYTSLWNNGITTEDLTGITAGNYSVTITDANGCTATLLDTVNLTTGITGLQNQFNVSLYPNPTQDKVFIDLSLVATGNVSVTVYNVDGQLIQEFAQSNITNAHYEMNFKTQAAGVYIAKIKAGDATITKRIVVTK